MTPSAPMSAPCPWCNSTQTKLVDHGDIMNISCHECGAMGPMTDKPDEAVIAWNTRRAPMSEWRPIESAPKDDRFVLLFVPEGLESGQITMGCYINMAERDNRGRFAKGKFYPADWTGWLGTDGDGGASWCEPTHWQPLPAPPAADEEGKGS